MIRMKSMVVRKTPLNFWFEGEGPEHFYKFRDINENTQTIITKSELYFGSADDFNDPFDFLPVFTMEADRSSVLRYLESTVPHLSRADRRRFAAERFRDPNFANHVKQAIATADASLTKVRKSSGLLCLSSRPDHMLLWGHYANSHTGIALRFKPAKGDGFFETASEVVYQQRRDKVNLVLHDTVEKHKLALLTKADFWAYEEEWRIVGEPGSKGVRQYPDGSLDGIILGAKISEENERKVRGWVDQSGKKVEWLRARVHPEEFRLDIAPC